MFPCCALRKEPAMLGLPKSTEIKKQLPKKAVYQKFAMDAPARARFDTDISRLDIVNEVSATNTTFAAGDTVKSFYVLLVTLKKAKIDEKNIILLSRLIEQNMLFILAFDGKAKLAVYHTRLILGEMKPIDELTVKLTGLEMDAVWENMIVQIGDITIEAGNTLDEQIQIDEKRRKLQKQIDTLEKQVWKEKQPKKKFEICQQVKKLKGKLET